MGCYVSVHTAATTAHTVAETAHAAAVAAHTETSTAHMAVLTSHTVAAPACIDDVKTYKHPFDPTLKALEK